jgi:hypothetical protein
MLLSAFTREIVIYSFHGFCSCASFDFHDKRRLFALRHSQIGLNNVSFLLPVRYEIFSYYIRLFYITTKACLRQSLAFTAKALVSSRASPCDVRWTEWLWGTTFWSAFHQCSFSVLLLSEGRADKTWETSKKAVLFRLLVKGLSRFTCV